MTQEEALEKLKLEVGASQQEIQEQYQEFYNEFQMRITNAPTTHQKTLYQKKLKQLEEAFTLLTGKETEILDADLPWSSPGQLNIQSQINKSQEQKSNNISKSQALKLLGLQDSFTKSKLLDAYITKKSNCEQGLKNAINNDIANSYNRALSDLEQAYKFILPLVKASTQKHYEAAPVHSSSSQKKKKTNPMVWIVLVFVLLMSVLFVFKPWEEKIDPILLKVYQSYKTQAIKAYNNDSLNIALKYFESAEKYLSNLDVNGVNKILEADGISDSIKAINAIFIKQKELAIEKEKNEWEKVKQFNTLNKYDVFLKDYPKTIYKKELEKAIKIIKDKQAKEYAVLRKLNQDKAIKSIKKDMVFVKGGTFMMGSTPEQTHYIEDEKPAHQVSVNSFKIGKYEVTQEQWYLILGSKPFNQYNKGCDDCPVENVNWYDVQKFLKKINSLTGSHFRLPTEAEWEFAARGGIKSLGYKYAGSNNIKSISGVGRQEPSGYKSYAVGQYNPNELGLYDMSGNVREWCSDWYGENYYQISPKDNPKGPSSGDTKVTRGGSNLAASLCRIPSRIGYKPTVKHNIGFRLVTN